jgi:hypothetical protein
LPSTSATSASEGAIGCPVAFRVQPSLLNEAAAIRAQVQHDPPRAEAQLALERFGDFAVGARAELRERHDTEAFAVDSARSRRNDRLGDRRAREHQRADRHAPATPLADADEHLRPGRPLDQFHRRCLGEPRELAAVHRDDQIARHQLRASGRRGVEHPRYEQPAAIGVHGHADPGEAGRLAEGTVFAG